jgi:hypothetical protein
VIVKGGSRSGGAFFARHLLNGRQNERVSVIEIRGLVAQTVPDAFHEMQAVALGTKAVNYFYHASLNPDERETLTPEQWEQATDILEHTLGLTGQARLVVEHVKGGRTHRHVIWSRIDRDTMTALPDGLTYAKHEQAARAIEAAFGHAPVPSVLVRNRGAARPPRRPQDWEGFRGQDSALDPAAMKAEVTALWQAADTGTAFAAALAAHGHILARGDRRDFVLVDAAGDDHSLARRIAGAKAADIRARMGDIDRDALPSVAEARALARQRQDAGGDTEEMPSVPPAATAQESFAAVHSRTIMQATADAAVIREEETDEGDGRIRRVRAWLDNMHGHFAGWRDYLHERVRQSWSSHQNETEL